MGGGGTETKTESTAPNNPMVDSTTTKLLGSLQSQMDKGTAVFGQSLQPGAGQTTQNSWASTLGAANNPAYSSGVSGATADFADAAAGNQYGANDAYYAQKSDDTLRDVSAMFTNSGRFGSGSHVDTATTALGNVNNENIAADRAWQMQAAGALPSLYAAGLAPSGIMGAVGAEQDANALALRQGEADLFDRRENVGWKTLGNSTSILAGNAGNSGSTTTSTTPVAPWWSQALGYMANNAGQAAKMYAGG